MNRVVTRSGWNFRRSLSNSGTAITWQALGRIELIRFFVNSHSVLHLGDDHLCQPQTVADFRVNDWRVLDFLTVQTNSRNDSSGDKLRILGSRRLSRSLEAFW